MGARYHLVPLLLTFLAMSPASNPPAPWYAPYTDAGLGLQPNLCGLQPLQSHCLRSHAHLPYPGHSSLSSFCHQHFFGHRAAVIPHCFPREEYDYLEGPAIILPTQQLPACPGTVQRNLRPGCPHTRALSLHVLGITSWAHHDHTPSPLLSLQYLQSSLSL